MPEISCFRTPFDSQRIHVSKTILKSARQNFYPNFPLTKDKLSYKTSPSVRSEIAVLIVNTLTADHMDSRCHWENFLPHVQTPLSKKRKHFLEFLINFWNLQKILCIFRKNIRFIAQIIARLLSPKNVVTWITENSCFRIPFQSQRVQVSETMLKSARYHF